MKAMLYGSGSGKKPTYAKVHWYKSVNEMPEVGEDWEIAVIYPYKPDAVLITSDAEDYDISREYYFKKNGVSSGNGTLYKIRMSEAASTQAEIAANVYVSLLRAQCYSHIHVTTSSSDPYARPAYVFVPEDKKWHRIGLDILSNYSIGCTLDLTERTVTESKIYEYPYELYSTGSVAAGASRIYTTAQRIPMQELKPRYGKHVTTTENYYPLYTEMRMTVSVDESYSGTCVRMGLIAGQTYTGGNPATSKYKMYSDFPISAGKDYDLAFQFSYYGSLISAQPELYYLAFGAYNAGSTAINIPLRVKRWWLE